MNKFSFPFIKVFLSLLLWVSLLLFVVFRVTKSLPQIEFPYYLTDLASHYSQRVSIWAHFDGIHYLRIAKYGYQDTGTQAFFPLYPLLIRGVSSIGFAPLHAGLLISYVSLLIATYGLYVLFQKKFWTIFLTLLLFPTSFYFLAVYTESLFFALVIWFFIFIKQKNWFLAVLLAGLASATRVVGSFLFFSLAVEIFLFLKKKGKIPVHKIFFYLTISISGLLIYMYYLYQQFNDPLMFFHVQPMFGAGRSGSSLILLPQVLYRYTKMIFTVDTSSLLYQRIWLELITFLVALFLAIKNIRKIPVSSSIFVFSALILPTLTGSLSSIMRYILILIPFLVPTSLKLSLRFYLYLLFSTGVLVYLFSLFASGRFVA